MSTHQPDHLPPDHLPTDHLPTDRLAELDAGLLDATAATAARDHLAACSACQAELDAIAGLPALLAAAVADPIPADVLARVTAAIEREELARSRPAPVAVEPQSRFAGARRRLGARVAAGLLGAAAVLGGGYVVSQGVLGSGDDSPSSAELFEADGGSVSEDADDLGAADSAPRADGAGSTYSATTLDVDVQRLLSAPLFSSPARTPGTSAVIGEDGAIGEPDDVLTKACQAAVKRLAGTDDPPLAVDRGTYDGADAVVVVLPIEGQNAVDVWVVDGRCVLADEHDDQASDGLDSWVLEHRTVRP